MENEVVWDARAIVFTVSYIAMMGLLLIVTLFHSGQMNIA